jgi:hypothetical protein
VWVVRAGFLPDSWMVSPPGSIEEHILIKPLAFGYIRLQRNTPANELADLRQQMADVVASQGFILGDVFVESEDSTNSAFARLMDALHTSGVAIVAVPSMNHLARMESVSAAMKERIESETGARVLIVESAGCAASESDTCVAGAEGNGDV